MDVIVISGERVNMDEGNIDVVLQGYRKGEYGAYILSRRTDGPSLWIHVNMGFWYLYYFLDNTGNQAGYHSLGDRNDVGIDDVFFLQVGGESADGFTAPAYSIVYMNDAVNSARDFLAHDGLPRSIIWFEL